MYNFKQYFKLGWKGKSVVALAIVLGTLIGLSNFFHGGVLNQGKQQLLCMRDGSAVDRESDYEWLLNTCAINRGTDENPNWVISKRDMGLDASDIEVQ